MNADHPEKRSADADERLTINPDELARWQQSARAFVLLDVRRAPARARDPVRVPGAAWRDPATVDAWADDLDPSKPVVVYCVHGHEVSQSAAAALRRSGLDARFLRGGLEGWKASGHAVSDTAL